MRKQLNDVEAPEPTTLPLHLKYRPQRLKDVLGQDATIKSLETALKQTARPHTFLFTGPPGTGKTTLARIVAAQFKCDLTSLIEIDAASNSGIDDMRGITSNLRYNGFGASPNKAIIIDECHGLSKQAWDSLLKVTEEPPPHVFFFFCSTNPGKIPAAMVTRCQAYHLNSVKYDNIMDLLEQVREDERFDTPDRILQLVADACDGSPRNALVMLSKVHDCRDPDEAADLLQKPLDNAEIIELCRLLVQGKATWSRVIDVLKGLEETPAETIRIMVVNYLNKCVLGAKSDKDAMRLLDMLEVFLKPCNPSDKQAQLLVAFGRYIFG